MTYAVTAIIPYDLFGIIMNQALAHNGRPVVLHVKFIFRSAGALKKRKAACRAAFLLIFVCCASKACAPRS